MANMECACQRQPIGCSAKTLVLLRRVRAQDEAAGVQPRDPTILDDVPEPMDKKVVPAARPMRREAEGHHGYSRATPQASRPGSMHVSRVAEET